VAQTGTSDFWDAGMSEMCDNTLFSESERRTRMHAQPENLERRLFRNNLCGGG
jgi:hypothetical protein